MFSKENKVSNLQAMEFFRQYNQRKWPHQRLGQAFVNHFNLQPRGAPVTRKLFYCPNDALSATIIWREWVE